MHAEDMECSITVSLLHKVQHFVNQACEVDHGLASTALPVSSCHAIMIQARLCYTTITYMYMHFYERRHADNLRDNRSHPPDADSRCVYCTVR